MKIKKTVARITAGIMTACMLSACGSAGEETATFNETVETTVEMTDIVLADIATSETIVTEKTEVPETMTYETVASTRNLQSNSPDVELTYLADKSVSKADKKTETREGIMSLCSYNWIIPDTAKPIDTDVGIISIPSTKKPEKTACYEIVRQAEVDYFMSDVCDIWSLENESLVLKTDEITYTSSEDNNFTMTIYKNSTFRCFTIYCPEFDAHSYMKADASNMKFDAVSNTIFIPLVYDGVYNKSPQTVHTKTNSTNLFCIVDCGFSKDASKLNIKFIRPAPGANK